MSLIFIPKIMSTQKHEWRKKEKAFYQPKTKPEVIEVPAFSFATIQGEGNPGSELFADCIAALYSLSYAIKMMPKKMEQPPAGYYDYTVYPLEGVWGLTEEGVKSYDGTLNKDHLAFTIMIRQPDCVKEAFFQEMLALIKKKKPNPVLDRMIFETITDGKCVQMMHLGSFDDEPASFARMEAFAEEQGLRRLSKKHREIYLSDFRKVPAEELKTVLRFWVE